MIVSGNLDRVVSGHVGIDPGIEGAIAFWYSGRVTEVIDMPKHTILVGGSERIVVDYLALTQILTKYINQNFRFTVELTPVFITMKGGSSSSANWSLGYSQGFMTAFFISKNASFRFVRTQEWHKAYGYKDIDFRSVEQFKTDGQKSSERKRLTKLHSLKIARQIAPHIQYALPGKTFKTGRTTNEKLLDGRCEAVLIAKHGNDYGKRY